MLLVTGEYVFIDCRNIVTAFIFILNNFLEHLRTAVFCIRFWSTTTIKYQTKQFSSDCTRMTLLLSNLHSGKLLHFTDVPILNIPYYKYIKKVRFLNNMTTSLKETGRLVHTNMTYKKDSSYLC